MPRIETLHRVATAGQHWAHVASRHGVTNPEPPWRSSLEGIWDALDVDERALPQAAYAGLPTPERQLVALAHSLVAAGTFSEHELARRMTAVRARLEHVPANEPVEPRT
jgi:hypothetical protein